MLRRPAKTSNREAVLKYYEDIDGADIASGLSIFSDRAVYDRGSAKRLRSISEIENFYRRERALIGRHALDSVESRGRQVAVRGEFRGTAHGRPISTRFRDIWNFNEAGQVFYRRSWIEVDGI